MTNNKKISISVLAVMALSQCAYGKDKSMSDTIFLSNEITQTLAATEIVGMETKPPTRTRRILTVKEFVDAKGAEMVMIFDNLTELPNEAKKLLKPVGSGLNDPKLKDLNFEIVVQVKGGKNEDEANQLAEDRANLIKNHLIEIDHIDPDRLKVRGESDLSNKESVVSEPGSKVSIKAIE